MSQTQIVPFKEKLNNFRSALVKMGPQMKTVVPRHVTADRLARIALTEVQRVPKLLDCTNESLFGAIMQAAQLGFEPGGPLGHCYLIPFDDHKNKRTLCQFIPGYKGLVDLAHRSGRIAKIYARVVYDVDKFDYTEGTREEIVHVRGDLENEAHINDWARINYAYAVAWIKGAGEPQFEVLRKMELAAIRARSRARTGPWFTDTAEMAKKTALRRLCKMLPLSSEIARAVALDEAADANLDQDFGDVIDIAAVEPSNDNDGPPQNLDDLKARAVKAAAAPKDPLPPNVCRECGIVHETEAKAVRCNHAKEPVSDG